MHFLLYLHVKRLDDRQKGYDYSKYQYKELLPTKDRLLLLGIITINLVLSLSLAKDVVRFQPEINI